MNQWKEIDKVSVKFSDKENRWDIVHNSKMYYLHNMPKTTNPSQIVDMFLRNLKDGYTYYMDL